MNRKVPNGRVMSEQSEAGLVKMDVSNNWPFSALREGAIRLQITDAIVSARSTNNGSKFPR